MPDKSVLIDVSDQFTSTGYEYARLALAIYAGMKPYDLEQTLQVVSVKEELTENDNYQKVVVTFDKRLSTERYSVSIAMFYSNSFSWWTPVQARVEDTFYDIEEGKITPAKSLGSN